MSINSTRRYVKSDLVLRLQVLLHPLLLDAINAEFRDLLSDGQFSANSGAAAGTRRGGSRPTATGAVFRFNRRNLGRLRVLIDAINRGSVE